MKAKKMRRLLRSLGYWPLPGRGKGSHTVLEADGRPGQIIFAFHDSATIGPVLVRKILVHDAGYSIEEARRLVADA